MLKDELERILEDVEAKRLAKELETQEQKTQSQLLREKGLAVIDDVVKPVLAELEDLLKSKGFEVRSSINTSTLAPRASFYLKVPPSMPSISWPPSELHIVASEEAQLTWEIWGPRGKSGMRTGTPRSYRLENFSEEVFKRHVLTFIRAAVDLDE